MDWNARTPSLWDWDNWALNCKVRGTPEQIHPTDWSVEGDEGINNGPVYSSGDGGCSGSELGNVSSSKSSISASLDSSSKHGAKVSEFNFQPVEGFPRNLNKSKQPARVEDTGPSDDVTSVGFVEPVIGLKLGKRTYFEDVCSGNPTKMPTLSAVPTSSTSSVKKSRGLCQGTQNPCCQVEGCNVDLSGAKDYHRKHRVCETHSKCPKVVVAGRECRFCQQCSRFHDLSEFDEKKRSCRRRLSDHNARRRKPLPETLPFNSMRISSSFYDGRQQMNFALNRVPVVHSRSAANALWESSCDFKLAQAKGSWIRTAKGGGVDGELLLPAVELPNTMSTLRRDFDGLLPFKGNTAEVLNQAIWWERYGYDCPALKKFAIRVLSLTCSATGCERNWSVFDQIHSKRRNRLEQKRLNALVFVKYNLQLEQRQIARRKKDNLDPICLSDLESDDESITELEEPSLPQSEWTEVNECFTTQDLEATVRQPKKRRDLEASALASNLDATPDIRRALSLLSNSSWGSTDHEPTSFDQFVHTSSSQRAMHAAHQRFLLASSGYWQAEQPPASSHVPSLSSHCNDGQFQEYQLFEVPDQSAFFTNHHMP